MEIKPIFLFVFMLLLIFAGFIVTHETTHGMIFSQYGCKNITYGYDGNFYTDADCSTLNEFDNADVNFLQAEVEIVQYPLILLGMIIFISCQLKILE